MKISSIFSILFVIVCVLALLPHHHKCFEIKPLDSLEDKIIKPIESILPTKKNETNDVSDAKEHGNFDSVVRDIVRNTSEKVEQLTGKIKRTFSKITEGLDTNKTVSDGTLENFMNKIRAIYPGTKWCGDGNVSSSSDDLGTFSKTDSCCREHDNCPDNIESGSTKYGLENTGLFTRSHCDCDRKFYKCLKEAKNLVAGSIGETYFTILGPQCFREDYPIIDCVEEKMWKCEKYEFDRDGEKSYQWFDSPLY